MLNILTCNFDNELQKERINSLIQIFIDKLTFEEKLFLENCNDILYMYGGNNLDSIKSEILRKMYVKYSN